MSTLKTRTAEAVAAGFRKASLARAAGVSSSAVSQWLSGDTQALNGKSVAGLVELTGRSAAWWAEGRTADSGSWKNPQHTIEGAHTGGLVSPQAHHVSHTKFEDAPTVIAWECILREPLKAEFQTLMPDASMEPEVPRGARLIFITGVAPVPGDWVLCRDGESNLYLRELRQLKPGRWEAHALNTAFLPLDSERDALEVVAVFDGLRGRRGKL